MPLKRTVSAPDVFPVVVPSLNGTGRFLSRKPSGREWFLKSGGCGRRSDRHALHYDYKLKIYVLLTFSPRKDIHLNIHKIFVRIVPFVIKRIDFRITRAADRSHAQFVPIVTKYTVASQMLFFSIYFLFTTSLIRSQIVTEMFDQRLVVAFTGLEVLDGPIRLSIDFR